MTTNRTTTTATPIGPGTLPAVVSLAHYRAHPELPAPSGHLFASACWLIARHPVLLRLAQRVPGVVDDEGDVLPSTLAAAVNQLEEHHVAWRRYEQTYPAPTGHSPQAEARYEAWLEAGPQPTDAAETLGVMSRTELARLTLLATLSDHDRVPFAAGMLTGFDADGDALVRDWMTAVQAHRGDTCCTTGAGSRRGAR